VNAETIAKALGGRKVGGGWMTRCPAHDDREPSLSIRDGDDDKVLVCCHASCEQEAVIAALRDRGLWLGSGRRPFLRPSSRDKTECRKSAGRSVEDDVRSASRSASSAKARRGPGSSERGRGPEGGARRWDRAWARW
jgi:hypothetical protein